MSNRVSDHRISVVSIDLPNGTILSFRGDCSCGWEGELQYMAIDAAVDANAHAGREGRMTPPTDPLAELQAEHDLHVKRHTHLGLESCNPKHCRAAQWLSLCDRLAAARKAEVGDPSIEIQERWMAGGWVSVSVGQAQKDVYRLLDMLSAAERQRDKATAALEPAEAWITHVLGILAGKGHLAGRIPDADCRDDGRAIVELLAAALAPSPADPPRQEAGS